MNPWADLLRPIVSRPGDPVKPVAAIQVRTEGVYRAAAAVVVTRGRAEPVVQIVPIVAMEFRA